MRNNAFYIADSPNGLNSWNFTRSYFPYGFVMKDTNNYKAIFHKWMSSKAYFYFSASLDGVNFSDMDYIRTPHGEDITMIKVNGVYRAYGRMNVPMDGIRTIGVMHSNDFVSWTNDLQRFPAQRNTFRMQEILVPDELDGINQFYSMSVIQTVKGFFGFLNVYNPTLEKVHIQLIHSVDGISNWRRLNARKSIIGTMSDRKQLYGSASVIGTEVFLTTISAKFKHDESDKGTNHYYTELWKVSLTELYKFVEFYELTEKKD